jgi:hypothetical protein
LKINRLRAIGITDRQEQRVALFLFGADMDAPLARRDLLRVYSAQAKRMTRKFGMEYWRLGARLPRAVRRDVDQFLDPALLETNLTQYGADLPDDMADNLKEFFQSPEAKDLVEVVMRQAFVPDGNADGRLAEAVEHLPQLGGNALGDDIVEMARSMIGLWSSTDDENRVVEQLRVLKLQDIITLRDYTLSWPRLVAAIGALLAAYPDDPEAKRLAALAAAVKHFLGSFTLEARFVLFGLFLARTGTNPTFLPAARRARQLKVIEVVEELSRRRVIGNRVSAGP